MKYSLICGLLTASITLAQVGPMPREVWFDRAGDRLPDGVIARFGTTRFREMSATRLHVSADRKQVICSDNSNVRVWDVATGRRVHEWPLPEHFRGEVTPDGQRALHLTESHRDLAGGLEIWDVPQQRRLHHFTVNGVGRFQAVAMHPNGAIVATVDDTPREHRVRLWDLRTGKDRVIGAVDYEVHSLHFVHEGRRLLVNPKKHPLLNSCVEPVMGFDMIRGVEAFHLGEAHVLRVSDDGESFIADVEGQPRLIRAKDGERLAVWEKLRTRRPEDLLAFSATLNQVVVSPNSSVSMVQQLRPWVEGHRLEKGFTAAAFLPASGSEQATAWLAGQGLYQIELAAKGKVLRGPTKESGVSNELSALAWSRDSTRFRMKVNDQLLTFDARTQSVISVGTATSGFAPETSFDESADRQSWPPLQRVGDDDGRVRLRPSPDGQLVAVREAVDRTKFRNVHLYERHTGRLIVSLKLDVVGDLAFNTTSDRLVTLEPTGFRVWNVDDGQLCFQRVVPTPYRLPPGEAFGRGVAFAPDQRRLAIGDRDGTVLVWEIPRTQRSTTRLTTAKLETLWSALASTNTAEAWQAVAQLRDNPTAAVPFIIQHVKPVQPLPDTVAKQLFAELDSPNFRVREHATTKLLAHGDAAKAFVDDARPKTTSADLLKRLDTLDASLTSTNPARGDDLRTLRALTTLRPFAHRDDVRKTLTNLAEGLPNARVTKEVRRILAEAK